MVGTVKYITGWKFLMVILCNRGFIISFILSLLCDDNYVYEHGFNNTNIVGSELNCKYDGPTTTTTITTNAFTTSTSIMTTASTTTTSSECITSNPVIETTTTDNNQETSTALHTTNDAIGTTSKAFESTTENSLETSKSPTNPNVTDPTSTSTDKILIGVFVPVGIVVGAGVAFIVYSRCFKDVSVAPVKNSDIDLENQSDSSSEVSESQSSNLDESVESADGNQDGNDQNDSVQNTVDETAQ